MPIDHLDARWLVAGRMWKHASKSRHIYSSSRSSTAKHCQAVQIHIPDATCDKFKVERSFHLVTELLNALRLPTAAPGMPVMIFLQAQQRLVSCFLGKE
jgi:hypothetical protein